MSADPEDSNWGKMTPLHWAAGGGCVDTVAFFLEQGVDINIKDEDGCTPLHLAALGGCVDTVRCLVDKGADINIKSSSGKTPLYYARDGVDMMKHLVEKGADFSVNEGAFLHLVAKEGNMDLVGYLVDKGAPTNFTNDDEFSLLSGAAEGGHVNILEALVKRGANITIKNKRGRTPLYWALREHHMTAVRYLVEEEGNVHMKDGKWEDLLKKLREAITGKDEDSFHYHIDELEKLLQDNVRMRELLDASGTLAYAAYVGLQPVMETVIQKGADVNAMSAVPEDPKHPDRKETPLFIAACYGHVDIARYLVEQGADINIKDRHGETPLFMAARDGHVDIVRYLVEQGADIDIKGSFGETPLFMAACHGHVDIVRYLGEQGADINVKNDVSKCTPLHNAARLGHVDIVRYLVEQGADPNIKDIDGCTPLHNAARLGHVDIVRYLVEQGADLHIKDIDGCTPLHNAARLGHVDIVRYLVEQGADLHIKNIDGRTPLHLAAWAGHVDIARYLVDKGVDTNIKDKKYGETPLHFACRVGPVECVKYLLEEGADPTAKSEHGETPLSQAIRSRHKDVAALLLEHEKWKEMLRISDRESSTPMRDLIAFMPDVAERAFNRCVTTNEGKDKWTKEEVYAYSRNLWVMFNYEFLEDFQDEESPDKQSSGEEDETNIDTSTKSWQLKKFTKHTHPLFLIKKHGCSDLMKHPLVISLLDYKWKKFGRYIFFGNLFIYLIFLAFLTAFGLVVLSPVETPCTEVLSGSFNGTAPEDCGDLTIDEYQFLFVGAAFTIATALLQLAIEVVQLCRHPLEYLQDWVNWLEIPLYLCSMIFTFVFATPCLCVYNWQWQFGIVAVFLSWIGLVSFLQKWPVTGVYILMFISIVQSFLKIAFLALLLAIAFGLAFYMLFFEPDEMRNAFSHPGRAIVKVMTMTTGELDYDEIFHQQEGEEEIAFLPVSFILWIIFLVLIPVLLNNLLVGLAVGDVDSRLKTAFENRIELQIDLVLTCEELLESWPVKKLFGCLHIHRWYAIQGPRELYPNAPETLLPQWCKRGGDYVLANYPRNGKSDRAQRWVAKRYAKWWITDDYSTSGVNICNKVKPLQDPTENQLQQQSDQLAKLQQQSEEQEKQLEAKLQQLSEEQAQKSEEHAKEMNKQMGQLAGEVAAIKQLTEEQTQKSEEQAKEMREQTAQLAAEVATLRDALQKLITKMDV